MKKEEILAKVAAGEISVDEATKLLAEADTKRGGLNCRVSQKGAISVYGLQRMPVTLYVEQWERLLDFAEQPATLFARGLRHGLRLHGVHARQATLARLVEFDGCRGGLVRGDGLGQLAAALLQQLFETGDLGVFRVHLLLRLGVGVSRHPVPYDRLARGKLTPTPEITFSCVQR